MTVVYATQVSFPQSRSFCQLPRPDEHDQEDKHIDEERKLFSGREAAMTTHLP